ncbi:hypothetical protein [Aquibacillus sediminis]|uniref:hypothetical protein n=1 Tax=Aquibacillus sediminis TaxID=2574734 RepID=UPI00110842B7|nr:hypothetical protein [Aquibacillus sediminis]
MSKNYIGTLVTIFLAFILAITIFLVEDTPAIKYFPLDEEVSFQTMETNLQLLTETDQDEYNVLWSSTSSLKEPIYLRQDVSLLYSDGRLKGILSKWKENEKHIQLQSKVHGEDSSHYQAISFHHGEIHYPDEQIKSIQAMTHDELYVIDSPHSALTSFNRPTNANQKDWKHTLDNATNQQLNYHWKQLIQHFSIPTDEYNFVPLTDLYQYQTKPIPELTQAETNKVIGQLWEGLYKEYILGISRNQQPVNSFVPLILFDKQGTHLMVLFQDQAGEKRQLIQRYSFESL